MDTLAITAATLIMATLIMATLIMATVTVTGTTNNALVTQDVLLAKLAAKTTTPSAINFEFLVCVLIKIYV